MNSVSKLRRFLAAVLLLTACWISVPVAPKASRLRARRRKGSCRSISCRRRKQLPAAPFLMAAYAVAWLVIFGYVWSIWRRLSQVEQEIATVRQRIAGGNRR